MKHFLVLLETSKQITNKHPETTKNEWKDSHEVRGEEHCHENGESQATDLCFLFIKNHVADSVNFGDKIEIWSCECGGLFVSI